MIILNNSDSYLSTCEWEKTWLMRTAAISTLRPKPAIILTDDTPKPILQTNQGRQMRYLHHSWALWIHLLQYLSINGHKLTAVGHSYHDHYRNSLMLLALCAWFTENQLAPFITLFVWAKRALTWMAVEKGGAVFVTGIGLCLIGQLDGCHVMQDTA